MKKHGLSSGEKIKGEKEFKEIYKSGIVILSSDRVVKANYLIENQAKPEIKFGVAVSKKAGDSVWRNRAKRLIRESYRLNKLDLVNTCQQKEKSIRIVFSTYLLNQKNQRILMLADIMPGMSEIIRKVARSV